MSRFSLKDRVAVVTGASRGIGQAIALGLAEEGAIIIATDVLPADETVEKIKALGGIAKAVKMDVCDFANVEAGINDVVKEFGKVDILVNNAGITRDNLILRMTDEEFDLVIKINLKGVFNCTKAALRPMTKARYGRIINIASVVGLMGNAGQANYSASKGAVIAMTKTTAKEYGKRGITCNAIAPGFINTEMTQKLPEEVKKGMLSVTPLDRFGEVQDVAGAVCFLASPAAGFVTGETLRVDGGLAM